jgi:hypothetical protein
VINPDSANIVYAYFFVSAATITGIWYAFRHGVHTLLDQHIGDLNRRLDKIEYQLNPNHGESMRDAIDCIKADVIELRVNQAVIQSVLSK